MTDDIDELLSAYLDGEATPDEVARVEADPALRDRLDDLRAAAALVTTPVEPLPRDRADSAITAALDASGAGASVVDLARRRRALTIASIAAAVLLVGAIAIGVTRARSSSRTTFTAVGSSLPATVAERQLTPAAPAAGGAADTATAAAPPDLGDFADLDALLAAARQAFNSPPVASSPPGSSPLACPPPSDATVVHVATARVGGQSVEVRALTASDGTSALEVIDASCGLLAYSAG